MDGSKVPRKSVRKAEKEQPAPEIDLRGMSYPRISPGVYSAVGRSWQGPVWIARFKRWGIRVEFELLDDNSVISRFFNLGSDPERPRVGRKSVYLQWWSAANGEPPKRGQNPHAGVFCEGQTFEVLIQDAKNDRKQRAKRDDEIYSRITELVSVDHKGSATNTTNTITPTNTTKVIKRQASKPRQPPQPRNQVNQGGSFAGESQSKVQLSSTELPQSPEKTVEIKHFDDSGICEGIATQASPMPGEGSRRTPKH